MSAVYELDFTSRRTRVIIPSFCRDSVIGTARSVEIEAHEDLKGKYLKLRPIQGGR